MLCCLCIVHKAHGGQLQNRRLLGTDITVEKLGGSIHCTQAQGLPFRMHNSDHCGHSQAAPTVLANPIALWVSDNPILLAVHF
jgi:hypothetical protein